MMSDWQCPLCSGVEARTLFTIGRQPDLPSHDFRMVRCRSCGLASLSPRLTPDEIPALYQGDYEPFWGPIDEERSRLLRWSRRNFLAPRTRYVHRLLTPDDRLLDLGCATGAFLHEIERVGNLSVFGSDISLPALYIARRQALAIWQAEAGHLAAADGAFGVVTMWEVIEHVLDPQQTLAEVRRILKPGGRLVISTPNSASLQAKLWGTDWTGWHAPRHLQVFSPATLHRMLLDAGFTTVHRKAFSLERFYFTHSLRNLLASRLGVQPGSLLWQVPRLAGLLGWPLARLVDQMPIASSLVVEARR